MRLGLQHHPLDVSVVLRREAVLPLQIVQPLLQRLLPKNLAFRLQRVKHGGSQQQVENYGEDEREGPDVLRLHPQLRSARGAARGREGAQSNTQELPPLTPSIESDEFRHLKESYVCVEVVLY